MANSYPGSFVSTFKNYWINKVDDMVWEVQERGTRLPIGVIVYNGEWVFRPSRLQFNNVQLLDLAHAIKSVEKRTLLKNF